MIKTVEERRLGHRQVAPMRVDVLARRALSGVGVHLILAIISLVALFPALWMVSTSLKTDAQVFRYPPQLIPNPVAWENYVNAMRAFPFFLYLRNSVIVTGVATLGTVVSSSFVAFGFARRRFPERDILFAVVLSTMMLPSVVTMVPVFVLFTKLGWVNTFLPLTLPSFFGGGAFNIFLMRQFYTSIPYDYDEAARIDGASSLHIWWRLMIPLTKAPLAVITVFSILGHWNDFMGPLLYMNKPHMRTLALGLQFFRDMYSTRWNLLMAAATLMTLPVIILFFSSQRYFLQGIIMTGLAGR